MAKPKPGGRRPRKRERKNVTYGVAHIKSSFNNTIVTITDQEGNVLAWASAGNVGFKGSRKTHARSPRRWPPSSAPARAMEHGVRKVDVMVKGPGSGRETAIRSHPEHRHRGHRHQGRHPGAPQRLPPSQAAEGLSRMARYTGPRSGSPAASAPTSSGTTKGRKALEKRPYPPGEHGRTRRRAARREYCSSCRRSRRPATSTACSSASSQPLQGGQPPPGRHRREPAPLPRAAPRQRRVPGRLGRDPPAGPPVRGPRAHRRQRPPGRHPELPGPQGRRRRAARQGPAMIVIQQNLDMLDRALAGLARGRRRRQVRSPSASCPLREQIDVPVREQLIVELYSK